MTNLEQLEEQVKQMCQDLKECGEIMAKNSQEWSDLTKQVKGLNDA